MALPTTPWRSLVAGALALLLSACASQQTELYNWGSYESQVYARFKNSSSPEQQIAMLEKDLQRASLTGRHLPPGFHAHLGLLYGESGRAADMRQQFETEKTLFPEAAPFMNFLLRKFDAPKGAKP